MLCKYLIGILAGLFIPEINSLKLWNVIIPTYKFRGESTLLECQYELNNNKNRKLNRSEAFVRYHNHQYQEDEYNDDEEELLYSVKWYKDNEEFYRFVPKAKPAQHSYRVDGIKVEHALSDSHKIYLKALTLKSSGIYRCEVSAEAPSFASVQGEGRMDVIFIPKEGPLITGDVKLYQNGEFMEINCTSGKSYPASTLHWFVNDQLITNPNIMVTYPEVQHSHGLITTSLGLNMIVNGKYFKDGAMRIKCVASLSPVLWRGGKESIVQWQPPPIDNREAMLLVRSVAVQMIVDIRVLVCLLLISFFHWM